MKKLEKLVFEQVATEARQEIVGPPEISIPSVVVGYRLFCPHCHGPAKPYGPRREGRDRTGVTLFSARCLQGHGMTVAVVFQDDVVALEISASASPAERIEEWSDGPEGSTMVN
jgi:hypothetical protein